MFKFIIIISSWMLSTHGYTADASYQVNIIVIFVALAYLLTIL